MATTVSMLLGDASVVVPHLECWIDCIVAFQIMKHAQTIVSMSSYSITFVECKTKIDPSASVIFSNSIN